MSISRNVQLLLMVVVAVALGGGAWYFWQLDRANEPTRAGLAQSAATPTSQAFAAAAPSKQLIGEVMRITGLQRQIEQLPEQARNALTGGTDKLPPETARAIAQIMSDALIEENINGQLAKQLEVHFDQKRMRDLVADFSTPPVKRLVAMETQMGSPQERAEFFNGLAAKPLPPTRVAILQELDSAANGTEMSVEIAMASITAMTEAMAGSDTTQRAAIHEAIQKQREQIQAQVRNTVVASMAYMYRNVSDADLQAYIQIYSSDQAKWFSRVAMNTLKQGMQHASARTGERLVAFMKSQGVPALAVETGARPVPAENTGETATEPPSAEEKIAKASSPTPALKPSSKKVHTARATAPHKRKPDGDIQTCLSLEDNAAIARCAEGYR